MLEDKIVDTKRGIETNYEATVKNNVEMDQAYWKAIHEGMRRVCAEKSYFKEIPFELAGKTGTAQQSKVNADHGLFVCFAPYNNPEIALAVRIANGYTSDYVSQTAKDVLKWYFKVDSENDIVTGNASQVNTVTTHGD